jgi:hypothetical protein
VGRTLFAGLGQQRHVRRQGAAVAGAGRGFVRERRREAVGRGGRTLDRVAGLVVDVGDLVVLGDRLDPRVVVRVRVLLAVERRALVAEVPEDTIFIEWQAEQTSR